MVGAKFDDRVGAFCESFAKVLNLVLNGNIPSDTRSSFFGGKLIALRKKDGGIRPIAVGKTVRRLISKIVCFRLADIAVSVLSPYQLGFHVRGGAEAIVHAARAYLESDVTTTKVLLKIDFRNAFNTLSREKLLESIKSHFPEYWKFFFAAYGHHSDLLIDELLLSSESGVQQGDPLGPLLFCLALQPVISALPTQFNAWFLDDGTLGGTAEEILEAFQRVIIKAQEIGLDVNEGKCEVFVSGGDKNDQTKALQLITKRYPQLITMSGDRLRLLGAPLLDESIDLVLSEKATVLEFLLGRLKLLPSHQALYLLKNCLGSPKIIYALRCCNAWKYPEKLHQLDGIMRLCFQELCNVRATEVLDYSCWRQATLPVGRGGVGIRRTEELALPAFLASIHSTSDLVSALLPPIGGVDVSDAVELWKAKTGLTDLPELSTRNMQRMWDMPICNASLSALFEIFGNDEINTARLLAASRPESGAWLNALPSAHVGNLLNDESVKICVGLRIGAAVCAPHKCQKCGKDVDELGHHGLSCHFSVGRLPRHSEINSIICRSLVSVGNPSRVEPRGTSHVTNQRPDGYTTFAWERGLCMAWDFTCVDTVCASHRKSTSKEAGAAADDAEKRKARHYSYLDGRYLFVPVAFETFGSWGPSAISLVQQIGRRLKEQTGESRSHEFLRQRLAIVLQRGNAASVLGTMDGAERLEEIQSL